MQAAEPPTAQPPAIAQALQRIAQLRSAGYDLIAPEAPDELARLRRGAELVTVAAPLLPYARGRTAESEVLV